LLSGIGKEPRLRRRFAKKYELENEITRAEVLNRAEFVKGLALIVEAISARVMSCMELPRAAREDILRDLASWSLVLQEVERAQSRLSNGKRPQLQSR
jgi:hypothetical protein